MFDAVIIKEMSHIKARFKYSVMLDQFLRLMLWNMSLITKAKSI